ncbi:3383_t:CDS:1, partial [Racocetra persica]
MKLKLVKTNKLLDERKYSCQKAKLFGERKSPIKKAKHFGERKTIGEQKASGKRQTLWWKIT